MTTIDHHGHAAPLGQLDLRFGSNAVRLGMREWLAVGAVLLVVFVAAPMVWEQVEPLPTAADARVPYRLSNDYWQFGRYAARAAESGQTIVLGDSVVWGEYVAADQTWTACLNRQARGEKFANLGLDGTYPAALAGLVDSYGGAIRNRDVILHCNLLWMATARHDLRDEKAGPLNHPALLPQFLGRIEAYDENSSRRIGIVVSRYVPFMQWTEHLKLAYYDGQDLPTWTMDHPYANPLAAIRPSTVGDDAPPRHEAKPWFEQGIERQDFPWMDLNDSLQWQFFKRTVRTLESRHNRVFVVVGPFNEHMLSADSRAAYRRLAEQAEAWLKDRDIPYFAPEALPSQMYADASHPLAAGYERLAREMLEALPAHW
jgi:hypothetical protein